MPGARVRSWHQHSEPGSASDRVVLRAAQYVASVALLAILYIAAAKVGLSFAFVQKNASPVWPPTGIALAALLLYGRRLWPAVFIGAVIVNLGTDVPLATALGIGIGNTLEAVVGVELLRRVAFDPAIQRLRDAVAFSLAAIGCSTVSASFGVTFLYLSGQVGAATFPRVWLIWWLGDALGAILTGPVILAWRYGLAPRVRARANAGIEALVIVALVASLTFATFTHHRPTAYTVFPLLLWSAFRFGLLGSASISLLIATIAVWGTARGAGPFARGAVTDSLLYVQFFSGIVALTALVVSASDAERTRAETERARLAREHGAMAEAARGRQRLELLDRVTDVLIDEALEPRAIFGAIGRATLPALADWFVADLVDDDGVVRQVALQHVDPEKQRLAEELRSSFAPGSSMPLAATDAIEHGESRLVPELRESKLSPEQRRLIDAIGARSFVTVPMIARGHTLGALTFVATGQYAAEDVVLARVVGHRAALMLDNARLLDSARRAVRLRDEVLGIVAHDLRAPLSVIRLATDQLSRPPARGSGVQVSAIGRAATRMERLIDDLLDVASIEGGSLSLRLQDHELAPLLEDAVALAQARAAGKSLRIVTLIGAVPPVACDQQRIQQVLSNLIENAIRFTAEGGTITLSAETRGDEVVLAVSDTGPGIHEEQLPHIFDRYWRAPGAGVRGAGLGLSIARGIVEAHGGRMRCESKLGEGTTFSFTLPASGSSCPAG